MQCFPKKLNQPNVPNTKRKIIDFNILCTSKTMLLNIIFSNIANIG